MKIIVQAGGKGTRLKDLTKNKPKCLVPVNNKPILFHLFDNFKSEDCIVIGCYKSDILANYLKVFKPEVKYVDSVGEGNACGIREALTLIPDGEPFLLIWSDILLPRDFELPTDLSRNYIGLFGKGIQCSWCFKNNELIKEKSEEKGVAGFFIFKNKDELIDVCEEGSFTSWLKNKDVQFEELLLSNALELGSLSSITPFLKNENRCRPYNNLEINDDFVVKTGLTKEAKDFIKKEIVWYKKMSELGFKDMPHVLSYEPLKLEKIKGDNFFHSDNNDKRAAIQNVIKAIKLLHSLGCEKSDDTTFEEEYFTKTLKRLDSIKGTLPFSKFKSIEINGKHCVNPIVERDLFKDFLKKNINPVDFVPIHGDCTLTNILVTENSDIFFIDPRGYFGKHQVFGDPRYDWAKLYYSLSGNFDQFNIKNFNLTFSGESVNFDIGSNGYEGFEDMIFDQNPSLNKKEIKIIHAVIWLSLASHCWEDFDSMCVAFYNGCLLLNEAGFVIS